MARCGEKLGARPGYGCFFGLLRAEFFAVPHLGLSNSEVADPIIPFPAGRKPAARNPRE
jgi:hypothetical protein